MPGNADKSIKARKSGDKRESADGESRLVAPVGVKAVARTDEKPKSAENPKPAEEVKENPKADKTVEAKAKPDKTGEKKTKAATTEKDKPIKTVKDTPKADKATDKKTKPVKSDEVKTKSVKKDKAAPKPAEEVKGKTKTEKTAETKAKPEKKIATQHGVSRASFRTWAADTHPEQKDIAETCLAHRVLGDQYGGAYNRSGYDSARAELLQEWADYCFSACPEHELNK